jgi:hypothetical protein
MKKDESNEEKNKKSNGNVENEELKRSLEKQIVAATWVKTIAQITEFVSLSKLYSLNGDLDLPSKKQILSGVWIQTFGQLSEAIGASQELLTTNKKELLEIQKFLIMSDYIQSYGSAVEAVGQTKVLQEEQEDGTTFIP